MSIKIKIFLNLWLPVIVWAAIIFTFSSRPTGVVSEIDWRDFIFKKSLHIFEYAILTLLVYRAIRVSIKKNPHAIYISFVTSILYGLSDEYHQSFTPGRQPHLRDVVIDGFGSIIAVYLIYTKFVKTPTFIKNIAERFGFL